MRAAFAAAALALVALVAVPSAATAVENSYPPSPAVDGVVRTGAVVPGGTVVLTFEPGFFTPGEQVTFRLTGLGVGGNNLASFVTVDPASATKVKTAAGDGSAEISVVFPADARCTYTLTDSGTNPAFSHSRSFDLGNCSGLATTGSNNDQLLAMWIGGGALAFIGGGLVVATAVRKQRKQLAD